MTNVKFYGIWMDPRVAEEIQALTPEDGIVADTLREALRIGVRRMKRGKRK